MTTSPDLYLYLIIHHFRFFTRMLHGHTGYLFKLLSTGYSDPKLKVLSAKFKTLRILRPCQHNI